MTHSGVIIVDKPSGLTSHDVVHQLRKVFGTRKVGHAGTLDPMATGVLVVGLNSATRLLGYLSLATKEYRATIRLGASSTTDDSQGVLGEKFDASVLSDEVILAACRNQQGSISQVPSTVSAKKVNGRRAHELVRAGEQVQLAANQVYVESININRIHRNLGWVDLDIDVTCSSGTFIRAIARDVGIELGVGGHLTRLRRTRVGPFRVQDSRSLDELLVSPNPWVHVTSMADIACQMWPHVVVSESERDKVSHGQRLAVDSLPVEPLLALVDQNGELIALATTTPEAMEYRAVFIGGS